MSPDRDLILADWIRYKHRFTLLVLSIAASVVVSVIVGFVAFKTLNDHDDKIVARLVAENRALIVKGCEDLNHQKIELAAWFFEDLGAASPPERIAEAKASYDRRFPPIDCTAIPEDTTP